MLASTATIEMVAQAMRDHKVETLVVDPVSLHVHGHRGLGREAASILVWHTYAKKHFI